MLRVIETLLVDDDTSNEIQAVWMAFHEGMKVPEQNAPDPAEMIRLILQICGLPEATEVTFGTPNIASGFTGLCIGLDDTWSIENAILASLTFHEDAWYNPYATAFAERILREPCFVVEQSPPSFASITDLMQGGTLFFAGGAAGFQAALSGHSPPAIILYTSAGILAVQLTSAFGKACEVVLVDGISRRLVEMFTGRQPAQSLATKEGKSRPRRQSSSHSTVVSQTLAMPPKAETGTETPAPSPVRSR